MITEKEATRKAAKCLQIVNVRTGNVFKRAAYENNDQWELLFRDCQMRGENFDFVYDNVSTVESVEAALKEDVEKEWKRTELKELSMPRLRKIGDSKGVAHSNKDKLIELIVEKQQLLKGE